MPKRIVNAILAFLLLWIAIVAGGPLVAGVIHGDTGSSGGSATIKLALTAVCAAAAAAAFGWRRVWRH